MEPPGGKRTYEELVGALLERLQQGGTITDVNPGSVARTIAEAFAAELAVTYGRLSMIYEAGFLETATAEALDSVVALLGIKRVDGKQAMGDAVFRRDMRIRDRIEIPEGTELLITRKGSKKEVTYRTTSRANLDVNQEAIIVPIVVDIPEDADEKEFVLTADDLGEARQVSSLGGIAGVQIARPTAVRDRHETDEELRERASNLVNSAGGGTYRAIKRAVLATGLVKSVTFRDKNTAPDEFLPGELEVAVDAELDDEVVRQTILDAINSTKGPGIYVKLVGVEKRTIFIEITVTPGANLTREKRQALRAEMEQTVQAAFAKLNPGEKLLWNPVQAKLLGISGVMDLSDVRVSWQGLAAPVAPGRELPAEPIGTLVRVVPPAGGPAAVVRFDDEVLVRVGLTLTGEVKPSAADREALQTALATLLTGRNNSAPDQPRRLAYGDVAKVVAAVPGLAGISSFTVQITDESQGVEEQLRTSEQAFPLRPGFRFYLDQSAPQWEAGSS